MTGSLTTSWSTSAKTKAQASDGLEAVSIGLDAVVGVRQKIHDHKVPSRECRKSEWHEGSCGLQALLSSAKILTPDVRHALLG